MVKWLLDEGGASVLEYDSHDSTPHYARLKGPRIQNVAGHLGYCTLSWKIMVPLSRTQIGGA
jgi:hypothetical protein